MSASQTAQPASSSSPGARSERLGELLSRVPLADQRAFEEVYRLTSAHLYGVALRMLGNGSAAEDILQEAFINVWHHAGSYDCAKSQPLTWLTSIVRNRCLDRLRRREIPVVPLTRGDDDDGPDIDVPSDGPSPVELLDASANARSVRGCIDALDAGPRQAIALAFFQGLSHGELARHLGQPLGTVKSWIRRGLERLKRCLDEAGVSR